MIKMNEKQMERCIGMICFRYWKEDSEIKWKKNSQTRIGSMFEICKRWKWRIEIYSCDPGAFRWNDYFTKTDELRNDSLQMETIHLPRGSSTRPILCSRSWTKEGRQTIFFTPLDPLFSDADEAQLITDIMKPRKIHYQIHWRPEQDAVDWIHVSTAQDAGLEFWQTDSNKRMRTSLCQKNAS